jgi:hypothetical protein
VLPDPPLAVPSGPSVQQSSNIKEIFLYSSSRRTSVR